MMAIFRFYCSIVQMLLNGELSVYVKDRERVLRASLRQSQWRALSRYHNQYTPVISITHLKSSSVLYKNMTSTTEEVTPEIHQKRGT